MKGFPASLLKTVVYSVLPSQLHLHYTIIYCTTLKSIALHSLMIPANSRLCSSSRNIKEFQRDLRFSHSLNGFIHHSSKINFVFERKRNKLWLIIRRNFFQSTISLHNVKKKELFPKPIYQRQILIGGPPLLSMPCPFCHHSTSLSRSLGHAFSDTNPSMLNMSSDAFYQLQCCHSSSSCFYSCCYLQAPAKIATRWR